jgi:hypothetical protein
MSWAPGGCRKAFNAALRASMAPEMAFAKLSSTAHPGRRAGPERPLPKSSCPASGPAPPVGAGAEIGVEQRSSTRSRSTTRRCRRGCRASKKTRGDAEAGLDNQAFAPKSAEKDSAARHHWVDTERPANGKGLQTADAFSIATDWMNKKTAQRGMCRAVPWEVPVAYPEKLRHPSQPKQQPYRPQRASMQQPPLPTRLACSTTPSCSPLDR